MLEIPEMLMTNPFSLVNMHFNLPLFLQCLGNILANSSWSNMPFTMSLLLIICQRVKYSLRKKATVVLFQTRLCLKSAMCETWRKWKPFLKCTSHLLFFISVRLLKWRRVLSYLLFTTTTMSMEVFVCYNSWSSIQSR